jgi:hypothetical protein
MNKSINEWMVVRKMLSERRGDLKSLRTTSAVKQSTIQTYGDRVTEQRNEPQYDTKLIDKRIVEMQNADMLIEASIKQKNALVSIELDLDVNYLLSPME